MITILLTINRTLHRSVCDWDLFCYRCDASDLRFYWLAIAADFVAVVCGTVEIMGRLGL